MTSATVTMLHTVLPVVAPLNALFRKYIPADQLTLTNVVDDSIVPRISRAGGITPDVLQTICGYAIAADRARTNAILVTCSSISEAVDHCQPLIKTPILKIDDAMTDAAVQMGGRALVVATAETTLGPTIRQLQQKALAQAADVDIIPCLCGEAYSYMKQQNQEVHDAIICERVEAALAGIDSIVLAQLSMASVIPRLRALTKKPIFASGDSAIQKTLAVIGLLPGNHDGNQEAV